VLIAIDSFGSDHLRRIASVMDGWATWEWISEASPEVVYVEKLAKSEIVAGWPKPEWLLDSPVRFFQCGSAGTEAYLRKGLDKKPDFVLCSARGVMSVAVAEHAIALMLALCRRIPHHVRDGQAKRFERSSPVVYRELTGATACVVGLGDIGTEIARRCVGLGMHVAGVRRDTSKPHGLVEEIYPAEELKRAVADADHVITVLPGSSDTVGMFCEDTFAAMKRGARFYNLSRGSVVDERALIECLREGHLAGAGLDVFAEEPLPSDNPLWEMDNVLITPHCGGLSVNIADRMCDLFAANLINYRDGKPLLNVVNLAHRPSAEKTT
jgi:phosphoglycerate dehydrogenase-like enzyme